MSIISTLTQGEQIFYQLVWTPLVQAGNLALFAAAPWLKLPLVSSLFSFLEGDLTDYVFNLICIYINVEAVVLENDAHQAAYQAASIQLKAVAAENPMDSPAYQKALADAQASLAQFVHFDT